MEHQEGQRDDAADRNPEDRVERLDHGQERRGDQQQKCHRADDVLGVQTHANVHYGVPHQYLTGRDGQRGPVRRQHHPQRAESTGNRPGL